MLRAFVVVKESARPAPSAAIVTDGSDGLVKIDELAGTDSWAVRRAWRSRGTSIRRSRRVFAKNRVQRILREHVFDIGEEQLLVLLLVVQAEDQDWLNFFQQFVRGGADQLLNVPVNIFAITKRFADRGTRDQAAQVPPMHGAGSIVVRIEQKRVFGNGRLI